MSKKIKTSKKHRICRFTGCRQVLSIYNPETYCHVHQQAAMAKEASTVSVARY